MEILIEDIPEEGLEVEASEADAWFGGIIRETIGETFEKGDCANLKLSIHRIDKNVNITGDVSYTSHPNCDRCLAYYKASSRVPIHAVLSPLYESERQKRIESEEEVELIKEDLEFGFYEGDRFDLAEIVSEQMVLAKPMKRLCKEECKGLCQKCGKDLNKGQCRCKEDHADPRWKVLKNVKISNRSKVKGQRSKGRRK